jgi:hypothetical protein
VGEGAEAHEDGDAGHEEGSEGNVEESHNEGSETIAGIDRESTRVVALGVVLSLVPAGAALRRPRREVSAAATVICAAFALLDGRKVLHQLDEQAGHIASFAAMALLFHVGAAGVAVLACTRSRDSAAATITA